MAPSFPSALPAGAGSKRKPLAACVAPIFALSVPAAALAGTVTSCLDDGGMGTLRSVVAAAVENETVDFAGLDCTSVDSTITLAGGEIPITRNTLTIDGAGATTDLTIDASALYCSIYCDSRVFNHTGTGTLTLKGLNVSGGTDRHLHAQAFGGCIASAGNAVLDDVVVTDCDTIDYGGYYTPRGGAISVAGNLTLMNSTVSHSTASGVNALGGGVYASGDVTLQSSSISNNTVTGTSDTARGGGAYVKGNLTVESSSFSGNAATTDTGDARGGGAFVHGNMTVTSTGKYNILYDNSATTHSGMAHGGGIYAAGNLTAEKTAMVYNVAGSDVFRARGGGAYCGGNLNLNLNTLYRNTASGTGGSRGGGALSLGNSSITYSGIKYNRTSNGGGLFLGGTVNAIVSSTVSGNIATNGAGVLILGDTIELKNSTISGNQATQDVGGLYVVDGKTAKILNSTIAFNTAGNAMFAAGASLGFIIDATLQSSIISNNYYGSVPSDLGNYGSITINGGNLGAAANNLIRASKISSNKLPTDTLHSCPHLGRLRNNGGPTSTHALLSGSPAIDHGNNGFLGALYDQRGSEAVNGTMDYTRFSGPGMLTDIGAYEVQQDDVVFTVDFEDCVPLAM